MTFSVEDEHRYLLGAARIASLFPDPVAFEQSMWDFYREIFLSVQEDSP